MKLFHGLAAAALLSLMPTGALAQADPPKEVKERCGYKLLDGVNLSYMRDRFTVSDRMMTREVEQEIASHVKRSDACLDDLKTIIDGQKAQVTPETIIAYHAAVTAQRKVNLSEIREAYAIYGYRPSDAKPAPRYGFCRIHDNFDPPAFDDYYNNYYVSAVFIDRDPEAEVPDRSEFTPGTKAGERVLLAMAQWIAPKYKPFTSRDNQYCSFFKSANAAQAALDEEIQDHAIETKIQ